MFKDTLEITVNTGKILVIGFTLYAIAMLTKPAELELRTGQFRQWWSGLMDGREEQVSKPPTSSDGAKEEWGF